MAPVARPRRSRAGSRGAAAAIPAGVGDVSGDKELARLIRASRVLDPVLKRQWLRVLAHLTPADRARLLEILRSEEADPAPGSQRSAASS